MPHSPFGRTNYYSLWYNIDCCQTFFSGTMQLNQAARIKTSLHFQSMWGEHRNFVQGQRASFRHAAVCNASFLPSIGREPSCTLTAERLEGRLSLSLFTGATTVRQMWRQMPGQMGSKCWSHCNLLGQSIHCRTGWVDGHQRLGLGIKAWFWGYC